MEVPKAVLKSMTLEGLSLEAKLVTGAPEKVEQDSAETEDIPDLFAFLLPDAALMANAGQFALQYNRFTGCISLIFPSYPSPSRHAPSRSSSANAPTHPRYLATITGRYLTGGSSSRPHAAALRVWRVPGTAWGTSSAPTTCLSIMTTYCRYTCSMLVPHYYTALLSHCPSLPTVRFVPPLTALDVVQVYRHMFVDLINKKMGSFERRLGAKLPRLLDQLEDTLAGMGRLIGGKKSLGATKACVLKAVRALATEHKLARLAEEVAKAAATAAEKENADNGAGASAAAAGGDQERGGVDKDATAVGMDMGVWGAEKLSLDDWDPLECIVELYEVRM